MILNLRDAAVNREIEPTLNLTIELMAVRNPALERSLVAGMTGSAPGTATPATVISVA